MDIVINSKESLTAFVKRVAPETSMNPSRLKSAISKGYDFKHIKAFESALRPAETTPTTNSIHALSAMFSDYKENILDRIQADNGGEFDEDEDFEPTMEQYENTKDAMVDCASELTKSLDETIQAIALLESSGLSDAARIVKELCQSSLALEYLEDIV